MKINKNRKLMVFFGCLPMVDENEATEKSDEAMVMEQEDAQEEALRVRTNIIEGLIKNREVKNVSDLYVELPPDQLFNPITFQIHIPLSLQSTEYILEKLVRTEVEDFWLVYDGFILMVAALCDLDKYPFGVFDARDRALKILQSIVKVKKVAPCLFPEPASLVLEGDREKLEATKWRGLILSTQKPTEVKKSLRELYKKIGRDLGEFFEACCWTRDIDDNIEKIVDHQSQLLANIRDFLTVDWKQIRRKRNLIDQCRRDMAGILEEISCYSHDVNVLVVRCRDLERNYDTMGTHFTKLVSKRSLDYYTEPMLSLDIDSIMKTVEHVRSEFETYSLSMSELLSGLVGAAIGSIITLVASQL